VQFTVDLTRKNLLAIVIGACVLGLAIIPIKVAPDHLSWFRWQFLVYLLGIVGITAIVAQALIQSKEDHEREKRELERDKRQESIESKLAELREQLKSGTPKPAITESPVKLEQPSPAPEPITPPDIDGEVYRLVYSPRSAAWPIIRDAFKLQGRPDDATVDTDILVDMYLVNQNLRNPQYIKDVHLSAEVNGKRVEFQRQGDFVAEPFADHDFEYGLKVKDSEEVASLKPLFNTLPSTLQPQQPADGWIRFMAADINPEKIANGTIVLTVVNSVGKEYTISKASANKPRCGEISLRRIG
jgi:cytoskeletal protein RodZ